MGYRHSIDEILAVAVDLALERGIGAVTFGAVGRRAGVSDRMVVYYFPTKADLVSAVAAALGVRLQGLLADAFGARPLPREALTRRAFQVLASPKADPVFAVYFEMLGQAAAGVEPFRTLARHQADGWVAWMAPRLDADSDKARREQALATLAQVDGLLLVRHVLGAAPARAAARGLGVA